MDKQTKLDHLYIDIAERVAQESYAKRLKVGSVIVKDDNIISMGWNGTPSGMDNCCEVTNLDGSLTTKVNVLHSESNALTKLAKKGGLGAQGATIYTLVSPCADCAKLIKQSGIIRVVYKIAYRLTDGIDLLNILGVDVVQIS